ncbi:uncharacterized protein LOC124451346 [Xenia sp. Carnegie-2017]|uniref:uncharacterized protein LOC124451346 n=1 Tax=Xenia sp. Carnegie-2017 TaxID=2897299 RepID=UPI001F04EFC2|nr:uncharacterized protein LOC124451346 [Xenia sp. Carnegie-2017]
MALFQREQVGIKLTGTSASVPDVPKAKLMYYLGCMSAVLELDDMPREMTDYHNYHRLGEDKTTILLKFCLLLNPELLDGKCIFEANDLPSGNEFVELSSMKTTMVAAAGIMMGGRNVRVAKVMLYKPSWRRNNFDEPMAAMLQQLTSRQASSLGIRRERSRCVIS